MTSHPLLPDIIYEGKISSTNAGAFEAFVMVIDLKGFTHYTQAAMENDRAGAEIISEMLNATFAPLVQLISDHGGIIPYFAGDSFTAFFPKLPLSQIARMQLLTERIRQYIMHAPDMMHYDLGVKISVDYGRINWFISGKSTKYFVFHGEVLLSAGNLNSRLSKNDIAFSDELIPRLSETPICKTLDTFSVPKLHAEYDDVAAQFIPQLSDVVASPSQFREVVSIFIHFDFPEQKIHLESLDACIESCRNYDVFVKEIECGDKGVVLFAFLGAPLTYINLKKRALTWGIECMQALRSFPEVSVRLSMNIGRVYCGLIGGTHRMQYGIVGHSVNCASRFLKYAGPGEILVERSMLSSGVDTSFRVSADLKGVEGKVDLFEVNGLSRYIEKNTILVGRDAESQIILQEIAKFNNDQANKHIYLQGHAGIGKSSLIRSIKLEMPKYDHCLYISLYCHEIDYTAFLPFINYLKSILDYRPNMQARLLRNRIDQLTQSLSELERNRIAQVFVIIMGVKLPNSFFNKLDTQSRFEVVKDSFIKFFKAISNSKKLIIKLDDLQWIDFATASLLSDMHQVLSPMFLLSARPFDLTKKEWIKELLDALELRRVKLDALSNEAVQELIEKERHGQIDAETVSFLYDASHGNPFYLEQILHYLMETEQWTIHDNIWQLKDIKINLHSGIQSILLSRVDRLDPKLREAVKYAAVLGSEFQEDIFTEMISSNGMAEFIGDQSLKLLSNGMKQRIWKRLENNRMVFSHALLREALYDMQSTEDIKQKHLLAAKAIEKIHEKDLEKSYFSLLYHYKNAGDRKAYIKYLDLSAHFAKDNYRNNDAIRLFRRLLEFEKNPRERIKILFELYDIYELLGEWDKAKEIIDQASQIATELDPHFHAIAKRLEGKYYTLIGEYKKARTALNEAYDIFNDQEDDVGRLTTLDAFGTLYFRQGKYIEAAKCFSFSVDIKDKIAPDEPNFLSIGKLGLTYMNLGRLQDGIAILEKYLKSKKINKLQECILSINMGIIMQEYGDFRGAEYHYYNGLNIAQLLGNKLFLSIAYGSLGAIHLMSDNLERALDYLNRDFQLTKELGDKQGLSIVLGLKGIYHMINGDWIQAKDFYSQQFQISTELNYIKGVFKSLTGLMKLAIYENNYSEVLRLYDRAKDYPFDNNTMTFDLYVPYLVALHYMKNERRFGVATKEMEEISTALDSPYTRFYLRWISSFRSKDRLDLQWEIKELLINDPELNDPVYQVLNKRLFKVAYA